ncbi:2,3-bisphosphoglycerate-independent phosphoglycerate mutase [Globomyces pollinis-pini]|nr:2,3-bisphosphoglycerate-independent phosphoglycerate mutase [Globomyces pollinis-pini]
MVASKACLIVIDGWGIAPVDELKGDAIRNADTPVMDEFLNGSTPSIPLAAHGLDVGLPDGLMGNSEVGHLNIGAGRIVYQDIVRIELAIKNDDLKDQPAVKDAFARALKNGRLHLAGLVSDGGVHGHIDHLLYLLDSAKKAGIPNTFVHFFADGRDTAPKSAAGYLETLLNHMSKISYGKLATITGRYYAMDRDKRWERIQIAYEALILGKGEQSSDPLATVNERYAKDETDEFLKPIIINTEGCIQANDTIIMFNFRSDRMREINQALGIAPLPFDSAPVPENINITSMTRYKSDFPFPSIFPPQTMDNVLGEWLGKKKAPQSHIAETEKYAHVTFFFNGGTEASYPLEDRELVASPKVATYDLKPEMSAIEVAEKVSEVVSTNKYDFVMCNFAPPDMVGHTGVYEAAKKGVAATDKGIGIIYEACKKAGYVLFVTADHGNAEQMLNITTGEPHTAHTCNPVPFVMTSDKHQFDMTKRGALCDVAPTILDVMGLDIPAEMTGKSLLK